MSLRSTVIETPLGPSALAWSEHGLVALALPSQTTASTERALRETVAHRGLGDFASGGTSPPPEWVVSAEHAIARTMLELPAEASRVVDEALRQIPLDLRGMSDFRRQAYELTRNIPRGRCSTYAELARAMGLPSAARAVGRAMATNPFPIVVPCHRVLSSRGDLRGYSAPGGVRTKAQLLALEGQGAGGEVPARSRPQAELPFRDDERRSRR